MSVTNKRPRSGDGTIPRAKKSKLAKNYYGNSVLDETDGSARYGPDLHQSSGSVGMHPGFVPDDVQPNYGPDTMTHFTFPCDRLQKSELSQSMDCGISSMASTSSSPDTPKQGAIYSSVSQKLMNKMGWEGQGLGATGTGRLEPVEASQQRGRRGLGHSVPKLKQTTQCINWNKNLEEVTVMEKVDWMHPCPDATNLSLSMLTKWRKIGPKKLEISDETTYCSEDVLKGVLEAKTVFDSLGEREIQRARVRSNPFETIGKVFFQNRAALKMANMDAITNFMFTKPVDENEHPTINENGILYFADVCAAPGGFAEYAIWRRKTESEGFPDVHGFGFTLRSNDFKLQDFYAAPREFFEPHYGEDGKTGDGDIYKASNISNFCNFVKTTTRGKGIHFMMADGGFSVDGQENIQEILSKQLYLGQFTVALGIVREGGHFVCKLFDTFTPFTVGLIYLMYRCFKQVSIHKPNTSRPANSERYIICKWLRSGCESVFSYLFEVNEEINQLKQLRSDNDVMQIVPQEIMEQDVEFVQYIRRMNDSLGQRQIIGLQKIQAFCEDNHLLEGRQGSLRTQSLEAWKVPDRPRKAPERDQPSRRANKLLEDCNVSLGSLPHSVTEVKTERCLQSRLRTVYNYRFVVTSVPKEEHKNRGYYLGLGGLNVYRTESLASSSWERVNKNVELPPDTLVYAELVNEIRDMDIGLPAPCDVKLKKRYQKRIPALHIIDGICLNGFSIADMHLVRRHVFLNRFCEAVNKMSRPDLLPLRCKELHRTENICKILAPPRLSVRQVKNSGVQRVMLNEPGPGLDHYHVPVTGLMLLLTINEPWELAFSRTQQRKYFFNTKTNKSELELPKVGAAADFAATLRGAVEWRWRPGTVILGNDRNIGCDFLDSDDEGKEERPELLSLTAFANHFDIAAVQEQRHH